MAPGISGEIAGESKLYDYEFSDEIPVISLSGIDDVGRKKEEICGQIVEACEKWGMFQAVDHGVDTNLMVNMTRLARDFFALTTEEKLRFHMSGGEGGFSISSHLQVTPPQFEPDVYFSNPVIYIGIFICRERL